MYSKTIECFYTDLVQHALRSSVMDVGATFPNLLC